MDASTKRKTNPAPNLQPSEFGQINGREYQNLTHMTGVMSKKSD